MLFTSKFEAVATSVDLDFKCKNFTSAIIETAGGDKPPKPDQLSTGTKHQREERWQLTRGGTDIHNIKYTEICKAIRWRMAEEIQMYNEGKQLQDLEANKGVGSAGLVHRAFGFYLKVKERWAWLVLGWVTTWVLDCEACPTHWTGCQVGQVVSLLGLGTMVATLTCWLLPSGMSAGLMVPTWPEGFSLGTPVSSPN